MAAITVIPKTSIVSGTAKRLQAGVALTRQEFAYKKSSDGKYYKLICDGTAEEAGQYGIALVLHTVDADEYFYGLNQVGDEINLGSTTPSLNVAEDYVASQTAGQAQLDSDLTTDDYKTKLFYAKSTTNIVLAFDATGVQET